MAMKRHCDTCGEIISFSDARIEDAIARALPDRDCCQKCFSLSEFAAEVSRADALKGLEPGSTLKELAKRYGLLG